MRALAHRTGLPALPAAAGDRVPRVRATGAAGAAATVGLSAPALSFRAWCSGGCVGGLGGGGGGCCEGGSEEVARVGGDLRRRGRCPRGRAFVSQPQGVAKGTLTAISAVRDQRAFFLQPQGAAKGTLTGRAVPRLRSSSLLHCPPATRPRAASAARRAERAGAVALSSARQWCRGGGVGGHQRVGVRSQLVARPGRRPVSGPRAPPK